MLGFKVHPLLPKLLWIGNSDGNLPVASHGSFTSASDPYPTVVVSDPPGNADQPQHPPFHARQTPAPDHEQYLGAPAPFMGSHQGRMDGRPEGGKEQFVMDGQDKIGRRLGPSVCVEEQGVKGAVATFRLWGGGGEFWGYYAPCGHQPNTCTCVTCY